MVSLRAGKQLARLRIIAQQRQQQQQQQLTIANKCIRLAATFNYAHFR